MRHSLLFLLCLSLFGCVGQLTRELTSTHHHRDDDDQAYRDRPIHENPYPIDDPSTPARPDEPLPDAPRGSSSHGRLILDQQAFDRVKALTQSDPIEGRYFQFLRQRAEKLLAGGPIEEPAKGQMLKTSRLMLSHLPTLAAMYRLTGDRRFADRAAEEMSAVARFRDWAPSDFLATAEMTNAVAIGYDWTYDALSEPQRRLIAAAIVRKGLAAGLNAYTSNEGWTNARHNWNLVCNGGLIVGALATAEEDHRTSSRVLSAARESMQSGMSCFAPDGAWEEGVTYWNYATRYLAFAMAALQSETGSDWDLQRTPGLSNSGYFRMYAVGPTGLPFNFADSEAEIGNAAQLMYFARIFRNPAFAAFEQANVNDDAGIFDLLWYQPTDPAVLEKTSLKDSFGGLNLVSMRGSWTDPNATWVAMKGGSNQAHHGHLDLGTFVLDALGERWVTALGADNYSLPEYFGDRRFSYYRCATKGQNLFTFAGRNQDEHAEARLIGETRDNSQPASVLDLTQAYEKFASRVRRGITLIDRRQVQVQDEIELSQTSELIWAFHTAADVDVHGDSLTLTKNGKTMRVQLLSPREGRFDVQDVKLAPPQNPADGIHKVFVRLVGARGRVRFSVLFTPGNGPAANPDIRPLDRWIDERPRESR